MNYRSVNSKPVSVKRFIGIVLIIVVAITWLFTGGVAIQRVQSFDSVEDRKLNEHESFDAALGGTVTQSEIPFVFSRYIESGPFVLTISYFNHGVLDWRELRLHSCLVYVDADSPIDLIHPDRPVSLAISAKQYSNSTSKGIVSHTVYQTGHAFDRSLDIPFEPKKRIRCEFDVEFISDGRTNRIRIIRTLEGHRLDFNKTFWGHIGDC